MSPLAPLVPSWRRLSVTLLVVLTAIAVCVRAAPAAADSIDWKPCRDAEKGLECARVQVPLNWSEVTGPRITLAVIRRPASKSAHRIGSLFFNFGGPGASGVETVKATGPQLDRIGGGR